MSESISYIDMRKVDEDQRIDAIGKTVVEGGKTVGVFVDDEPGKTDRYIRKLREKFPGIILEKRINGPTKGCVTLRFAPPNPKDN